MYLRNGGEPLSPLVKSRSAIKKMSHYMHRLYTISAECVRRIVHWDLLNICPLNRDNRDFEQKISTTVAPFLGRGAAGIGDSIVIQSMITEPFAFNENDPWAGGGGGVGTEAK